MIQHFGHRPIHVPTGLLILLGCLASSVVAQQPPVSSDRKSLADRVKLADEYIDASFGFAVCPPTDCTVIREKHFVSTADVELVRFVNQAIKWSMSVRESRTTRPLDTDAVAQGITRELQDVGTDLKVVRQEALQIAGREGVRFAAVIQGKSMALLRQQAVIRTNPTEYLNLILVTPSDDMEHATAIFEQIVASFKILRTEATQKQVAEALSSGSALLRSLSMGKIRFAQGPPRSTFLRCLVGGKEVGFIEIDEQPTRDGHREGLGVSKFAWLFKSDGSITHMAHQMFLSKDCSYEKWENHLFIVPPAAKKGDPRQVVHQMDTAIRQDDKLLVTFTESGGGEMKEKVIEVEKSYASAMWDVLCPRVVDLKKPSLYAFSVYDSGRRGLVLRTFRVLESGPLRIGGKTIAATRLEQSEGLIPPFHEVWVDRTGGLIKVTLQGQGEPMEMLATSAESIDRAYQKRIEEAEEILFPQHDRPAHSN